MFVKVYLEYIPLIPTLIKENYYYYKNFVVYDSFLSKTIFLTRLLSYFIDDHKQQRFIPDIIEDSRNSYDISEYLIEYILEGKFPSKQHWRTKSWISQ